jgi:hypothetical protein
MLSICPMAAAASGVASTRVAMSPLLALGAVSGAEHSPVRECNCWPIGRPGAPRDKPITNDRRAPQPERARPEPPARGRSRCDHRRASHRSCRGHSGCAFVLDHSVVGVQLLLMVGVSPRPGDIHGGLLEILGCGLGVARRCPHPLEELSGVVPSELVHGSPRRFLVGRFDVTQRQLGQAPQGLGGGQGLCKRKVHPLSDRRHASTPLHRSARLRPGCWAVSYTFRHRSGTPRGIWQARRQEAAGHDERDQLGIAGRPADLRQVGRGRHGPAGAGHLRRGRDRQRLLRRTVRSAFPAGGQRGGTSSSAEASG